VVTLIVGSYLLTYLRPRADRAAAPESQDPEHACSVA
jgi:hypothetical protein